MYYSLEEQLAKAKNNKEFDIANEEDFINAMLDVEYKEQQLKQQLEDPLEIDSNVEFYPLVLRRKKKRNR